jgi:hypothetical protein
LHIVRQPRRARQAGVITPGSSANARESFSAMAEVRQEPMEARLALPKVLLRPAEVWLALSEDWLGAARVRLALAKVRPALARVRLVPA